MYVALLYTCYIYVIMLYLYKSAYN